MAAGEDVPTRAVGPYLLQRTLGKGQTGLVKLGVHCITRKTVAVKIINREKLSKSVLMKVEREIAIMKLINHPHVLGLFDVYENNTHLYLVLEHVSGGELFDYLVRKGRLSEREARRFFRQIVSAVDFCHKHKVCHRDLKPENLLLDESKNIKVADFGMASLQVGEKLLETSCGSPHYACPEVIRGEHYDGRKADVWSCGVILYALLVGALPFDDDNLRVLLEKVKKGNFSIPPYIPPGAVELLRGMVEVNARKRLTLDQVMRHSWFRGQNDRLGMEPVPPMQEAVQTHLIESHADLDPDVFKSMTSLGCFKDKHALLQALLSPERNEEKIIYFLLLSRKERQPSVADDQVPSISAQFDPPRKRVDSRSASLPQLGIHRGRSQSIGSANLDQPPRSPRLTATIQTPSYSPSSGGYYTYSSSTPPPNRPRKTSYAGESATLQVPGPGSPWKRKFSKKVKDFMGSPRFHRRRMDASEVIPESNGSPPMAKRSWFANFRVEREKEEVVVVCRDKSFQELKASLLQALAAVNCKYEDISENIMKVKYEKSSRQKGKGMFKKGVKFLLTVLPTQTTAQAGEPTEATILFDGRTFTLTFSQTAGPTRRFQRVCDKLQLAMLNPGGGGMVNPLLGGNFPDYDNPSMSSDDTLAMQAASPVPLEEEEEEEKESDVPCNGPALLCESTDECDSEDEK